MQTKGIEIFNKIIAENLPNLEKERFIQIQEPFRTPKRQDQKETPSDILQFKHQIYRKKKEY
jgi:hypothetical protein